jgi:hypothetical protein
MGHAVRDALVAQDRHQPVEQPSRVVVFDCRPDGTVVSSDLVNEAWGPSEATDPMDQPHRMLYR